MSPGDLDLSGVFSNPFDAAHWKTTLATVVIGFAVGLGSIDHFEKTGERPPKDVMELFHKLIFKEEIAMQKKTKLEMVPDDYEELDGVRLDKLTFEERTGVLLRGIKAGKLRLTVVAGAELERRRVAFVGEKKKKETP